MFQISQYELQNPIYESATSQVFRAIRKLDRQPVILKVLKEEGLTNERLERAHREFDLLQPLQLAGVIRAYEFGRHANGYTLVLEDFGGESLKELMSRRRLRLIEFLELAERICAALSDVHLADIIHKDINPTNLICNPATGEVKIIDFGISSLLPRLNPSLKNPESLEGTLPYIAPEQTGRMNRSLDYRADFYSLGATFYEMLSGETPFGAQEPSELIYSHIARQPKALIEVAPDVPPVVAELVHKLLAKNAEDRYQSAWGIQADLQECRRQWLASGEISPFALASRDTPHRFQISQQLYGRREMSERLLRIFAAGQNGEPQLVLLGGHPGIGKTSLVRELYKPMTEVGGSFVAGKFDQFQKNTPYSALFAAVHELLQHTLSLSESALAACRQRILDAVGNNGQVLIQVLPELEQIIGPQPAVAELVAKEAQRRFNQVFQRFIQVFCLPGRPLILFLDDLQWADLATLKLIEILMGNQEVRNLILIGAYRDNEVNAGHPLMISMTRLAESGFAFSQFTLQPLQQQDINQLLADTLKADLEPVQPLAELVHRKTLGNPFFVTQFLKTLYAQRLIQFRQTEQGVCWDWQLEPILAMDMTDNVVELMVKRLQQLPEDGRIALEFAACIGSSFDLDSLALIQRQDRERVRTSLMPALQAELIEEISSSSRHRFRFQHDRVQQAAYSLMDESRRQQVHLFIGRQLLAGLSEPERNKRLFEIADHLNAGRDRIIDAAESLLLAELDLEAGLRAINANAQQSAVDYLDIAESLLPADAWSSHYELALKLFRKRAHAHYLNAEYEDALADIHRVQKYARHPLDLASISALMITVQSMLGQHELAIQSAIDSLSRFGIVVPQAGADEAVRAELVPIRAVLKDRSIASLAELPAMTDPVQLVTMKILMAVHSAAYFAGERDLYLWFLAKMVNLSLLHGCAPESPKGYASFGSVLCSDFQEFQDGYEFAKLAILLADRTQDLALKCRTNMIMVAHVNHWVKHLRESEQYESMGIQAGMEASEFQFVSYLLMWGKVTNRFHRGVNLQQQLAVAEESLAFVQKVKSQLAIDTIQGALSILHNLSGQTASAGSYDRDGLSEADHLLACEQHHSQTALGFYHSIKAQTQYLYGDYAGARASLTQAQQLADYIKSYVTEADLCFYESLIMLAQDALLPRPSINAVVDRNQALLKRWAIACPDNFWHKYQLVEAERARLENRVGDAVACYDKAIEQAREGEFIQDEALANELACHFWLETGKADFALIHYRRATQCYQVWGAKRKLEQLATRFATIFNGVHTGSTATHTFSTLATSYTSTFDSLTTSATSLHAGSHSVDVETIIEAARVCAGEIRLDELKRKMMQIAMVNAGADTGFLILDEDSGLTLEAQSRMEDEVQCDLSSIPLNRADAALLPLAHSVVNYVARSGNLVVLSDASRDERFALDPHITATRPKSVLCLPLIHQGKLSGVLYLENHLASGAFTLARQHVLEMLSSQMAVAIENARIHQHLDQLVQMRTAQLEQVNRHLQQEVEERILMANQLRLAQEKAELATQAKSDFLARMSHEIRTPMNAVIGLSQLLLQTEMTPKQRDYVKKLGGSAQTLLAIINDILDFSKIEAGKMTLEQIPFNLRDVLDNLSNVTVGAAEEKGLEILFQRDEDVPEHLVGDPLRLGQVLINLVGNAIKFTQHGDVLVRIRRLPCRVPNIRLQFAVRDTGIGMNQTQLAHLFQSFHQADGSITRRFGGTGLGLAISRQLVELMTGHLDVESEVGRGTTFTFEVEFAASLEAGAQAHMIPEQLAHTRVLVVDDNPTSREILSHMLKRKSFTVETAASGEEALRLLAAQYESNTEPYGLVLMDWRMPGLDGIETTRRIKNELQLETMPAILMVTAFGREEIMQEAHDAGLDGFLVKPVNESLLYDTILDTFGFSVAPSGSPLGDVSSAVPTLGNIRGARILLVEDNAINQQVATEFLEQLGMLVDVANHGREGVEMAAQGQYDLVLMDIQMPEMDGFEATRRIRELPQCQGLPIVAMTAHAMAGDREKSLDAGMYDHLTKPINITRLSEILVRWIKPAERELIRTKPADEARAQALPDIDKLDVPLGIHRVGGSTHLFLKLIRQFCQDHAAEAQKIRDALSLGQRNDAERLAHTIKGAAASLGATDLSAVAAELESELRGSGQPKPGQLEAFASELSALVLPLQDFFNRVDAHQTQPKRKTDDSGLKEWATALYQLASLLEDGDSEAEDVAEALCLQVHDTQWQGPLQEIMFQIQDVEFADALALVQQLLKEIEKERI